MAHSASPAGLKCLKVPRWRILDERFGPFGKLCGLRQQGRGRGSQVTLRPHGGHQPCDWRSAGPELGVGTERPLSSRLWGPLRIREAVDTLGRSACRGPRGRSAWSPRPARHLAGPRRSSARAGLLSRRCARGFATALRPEQDPSGRAALCPQSRVEAGSAALRDWALSSGAGEGCGAGARGARRRDGPEAPGACSAPRTAGVPQEAPGPAPPGPAPAGGSARSAG